MIKTKGFLWQSQQQRGMRNPLPFTPCSQLLVLELKEDLALASGGGKVIAYYLGVSTYMPEQRLLLQNLESSDGGREMLMVMVAVLLLMMMMMMKEENSDGECHL